MPEISFFYYASLFAVVVISLVLAIVVIAYQRLLRQFHYLDASKKRAQELLDDARKQMVDARKEATTIISEAEAVTEEQQQEFADRLATAQESYLKEYQHTLKALAKATENALHQTVGAVDVNYSEEIRQLRETFRAELEKSAQKAAQQAANTQQQYYQDYYKKLFAKVESEIQPIAQQVFGAAIDLDKHSKLIEQAIDKAAAEEFFENEAQKMPQMKKAADGT